MLAKELNISKSKLALVSGGTNRNKVIRIENDFDLETVKNRIKI